jgi:hypothetical protein
MSEVIPEDPDRDGETALPEEEGDGDEEESTD